MNNHSNIIELWAIICEIVRDSQLENGSTKNPIVKSVYVREAAFSSNILSTNAMLFDNKDSITAKKNYLFVSNQMKKSIVFDEPIWTPRGESLRNGSVPATVYLFDALEETCSNLSLPSVFKKHKKALLQYLASCRLDNGLYSHDVVQKNSKDKVFSVINTTLMGEWLRSELTGKSDLPLSRVLKNEQLKSGVWPYLFSTVKIEKIVEKLPSAFSKKDQLIYICRKLFKDRSIFFTDFHHHAVTLQYFLKTNQIFDKHTNSIIKRAYSFIDSKIVSHKGDLRLDFTWEPQPNFPRYSNFKDTTTYFVIMEIYYLLQKKNIISQAEALQKSNMLSGHILKNLVHKGAIEKKVYIYPYEGTKDEINLIFPRPAESVFHKGHLMSNTVKLAKSFS